MRPEKGNFDITPGWLLLIFIVEWRIEQIVFTSIFNNWNKIKMVSITVGVIRPS